MLYNKKDAEKYWDLSLPKELKEDETVRVVSQVKEADGSYGKFGILTIKEQIRSAKDTMAFMDRLQMNNPGKEVGISISTTVFEFNGKPPSTDNFRYTNTISIDIDTHIGTTKERYVLGTLEEDQIELSVIKTWLEINSRFKETGLENIIPVACTLTGGGLQFVLGFDRSLDRSEAQRLFGLIKNSIKDLKWRTVLRNILGEYTPVEHDIDSSFADIVHVQRMAGTSNQKYNIMSRFVPIFEKSGKDLLDLKDQLQEEIKDKNYTDSQIKIYQDDINESIMTFINDRACARNSFEVEDNLITARMHAAKTTVRPSDLKSIEYELLQKIKKTGVATLDLLGADIHLGQTSGNLSKLYCPFHEETNPSMAFYENDLFDVFKDFHDDKSYNLISFWEKLYDVSKSTAITQIAERAGVPLAKSERKDFQNLELDEIIDVLIERINTEDFIYYRLASKNRSCIVRHIDTGDYHTFDGPKMLANHVLQNQLKINDVEKALVEEFAVKFQEKVLIDAFEEFRPQKKAIFFKEFIKFVNLWVPSKRYQKVQANLAEIDNKNPLNTKKAISLLKSKTPNTYKYLLQMIQNGDLPWFINWLSGITEAQVMPTIPVFFGVGGAGKNLFVNTILNFYLNDEYVKIVSGDRIMQQFNSMLESASLLVLDEGDFSSAKEVDQLKLLSGNDKILIEKKGVDATSKSRHFNILFFSNGEVPLRHPATDRRLTYFYQDTTLLSSCKTWGMSIDNFIIAIKKELVDFWTIISNAEFNRTLAMANCKNGQFWKQILRQHPFGSLVVKLLDGEWEEIALQLNENVTDDAEMKINLELLTTIKEQFEREGQISLSLINRYVQSLNFKMKTSIQRFIQTNHLHEFGINIHIESSEVKILVDKNKVRKSLNIENVLLKAYPNINLQSENILAAELAMEKANSEVEAEEYFKEELTPPPAPELV